MRPAVAVSLVVMAGCASPSKAIAKDPLETPRNETWPEGWAACTREDTQKVMKTRPREAADECGLGVEGCLALKAGLTPCTHLEPNQVVLLVSTDEAGKVAGKCVAAASGVVRDETFACLARGLSDITAAPSRDRAVVRLELEPFVFVGSGAGLASNMLMDTFMGETGRIERCVEQHLAESPVRGKLVMEMRVAADGTVSDVKARPGPFDGTPAQQCITEVFTRTRFPAHQTASEEPVVFPVKI